MHEKHQLVMIICHYRIFNAFDVNQLVSSLFDKIVTAKFTLKECPATIYAFCGCCSIYIYIFLWRGRWFYSVNIFVLQYATIKCQLYYNYTRRRLGLVHAIGYIQQERFRCDAKVKNKIVWIMHHWVRGCDKFPEPCTCTCVFALSLAPKVITPTLV